MLQRVCSLLRMNPPVLLNRGLLFSSGATVPSSVDGYQPSCLFQDTTNGVVYVNEGSVTSCDFNALGDLTTVDYSAGDGTAITISGVYTVEGISITNACVHGIRVGAFASSGSTASAMVLDATTPTAVEIHGGLSADPGSGTNARPLRSRFIINTGGNVEAETYGLQGQLVTKSSNLGHWHGGVMGTIECQTALSVYNPLAGVGALLGRIGGSTITVQSSCYLAGVIALASAVSLSNSGVYAGLYVTKTSGATNFSHGAYIENSDIGIRILSGTTPDTARTNHALVIGGRGAAELTVTFTANTALHYEPIQTNFDMAGVAPTSESTVNIWQGAITHDTRDMANLRLKFTDLLTTVAFDCKDVYIHQAEIILSGTTTVSREVAVLGLVCNAGSGTITCGTYNGVNITMRGSGTPAHAAGLMIHTTSSAVVAYGLKIYGTPQPTIGLCMGDYANDNQGPTHLLFVPSGPGADVGPVVQSATGAGTAAEGSIKIKVGSSTKYLQYFAASS